MADNDYQGITFIDHSGGASQENIPELPDDMTDPVQTSQDTDDFPQETERTDKETFVDEQEPQTLEDTFLTVQDLSVRLIALEQAFAEYKEETKKKFEHLEKKVKAGNKTLAERILEIQEDN